MAIFSWTKSKKSRAFLEFRPYSAFNFGGRNRRPKAENFPFWPKGRNSGIPLQKYPQNVICECSLTKTNSGIANEKSFEYSANYIDLRSRNHKLFLLFKTSYYSLQVSSHEIDIFFCRLSQKVTEVCFGIVHIFYCNCL